MPDDRLGPVLAAHGGLDRWRGITAVEAVISVDGFLFTAKHRPPLRRVKVRAWAHEPRFTVEDPGSPGGVGEWIGDEVRQRDVAGAVTARRDRARAAMFGLRRELWWDDLDFLYFSGYAMWNYLTTPFLLANPGVEVEPLPPGPVGPLGLRATFPASLPTHCRTQDFWFGPEGELRRLVYVADVVGWWARVAHDVSAYREAGGLRFPTRRRVYPLFGGSRPLPGPLIVGIDVHEIGVSTA